MIMGNFFDIFKKREAPTPTPTPSVPGVPSSTTPTETPKVEGFELFVLGDAAGRPSGETDGSVAGIVAVGEYNPESGELNMAMWDEVKEAVEKMKEMESVTAPTPSTDALSTGATKEPDNGGRTDDLMALIARVNGEE